MDKCSICFCIKGHDLIKINQKNKFIWKDVDGNFWKVYVLKCSHLGRKVVTNLDSILKSRDITLPTKVRLVKAVSSSGHVWIWEWTVKKAERQKIDAFELWCWGRLLRVPWTARGSNQSILKEIQSWVFIGRTDAEAPILWPPDVKSRFIGKDPVAE